MKNCAQREIVRLPNDVYIEKKVKYANVKRNIRDPESGIKAILLKNDFRELHREIKRSKKRDPEKLKKLKELAKEIKRLAIKAYVDPEVARKYFTFEWVNYI